MKSITIIIVIILACSCNTHQPKKPFVIVDKENGGGRFDCDRSKCVYVYQDATGVEREFCDGCDHYGIGDTIVK